MFCIFNMRAVMAMVWLSSNFRHSLTSVQPLYRVVGDSVDLNPGPVSGKITSLTWKHGSDIAMEAFGNDVTYYRDFNGSCAFNTSNGVLTIRNLAVKHSGTYKAEVNSKDAGSQELKVLIPVSKPTVSVDYNKDETFCNLTCDFKTTPEMGEVVQTWVVDGKDKPDSGSNKMSIADETVGNEFSCFVKNPVSSKSSDAIPNPLKTKTGNVGLIVGIILLVILILTLSFYFVKKTKWLDNIGVIHNLRERGTGTCTGKRGGQPERVSSAVPGTPNSPTPTPSPTLNGTKTSKTNDVTFPLVKEVSSQATEKTTLLKDQEALNQVQIAVDDPKTNLGPSDSSDTPEPPVNQIVTSAFIHSSPEPTHSSDSPELPDDNGVTPATGESSVKLMIGESSSAS